MLRAVHPALCLDLLSQWPERRQGRGGVAPGQVHPGLAEWQAVRLRQPGGRREVALAKQGQHLRGGNPGHLAPEVALASGLLGPGQHLGRASHVAPGQLEAGQEHLADDESVDRSV